MTKEAKRLGLRLGGKGGRRPDTAELRAMVLAAAELELTQRSGGGSAAA